MNKILRGICFLPAILFIVMGIRWAVAPEGVATELGMTLMEGRGLSSQLGDIGSFFLGGGIIIVLGLVTLNKTWLYAGALLTALAAVYRVIATVVHGVDLVVDGIAVEIVITGLLLFAASRIQPVAASDNTGSDNSEG